MSSLSTTRNDGTKGAIDMNDVGREQGGVVNV